MNSYITSLSRDYKLNAMDFKIFGNETEERSSLMRITEERMTAPAEPT